MVAAGVTLAIAVQYTTKYLEDRAVLAARAEMEKLMMTSLAQQNAQVPQNNEFTTSNTTKMM